VTREEDFIVEPPERSDTSKPEVPATTSDTDGDRRVRDRLGQFDEDAAMPFLPVTNGTRFTARSEGVRKGRPARDATDPSDRRRAAAVDPPPQWEEEGKPHPINWCVLGPEEAEKEWGRLDAWVYWLRDRFGLTPQEIPPAWHRHDPLVWELSALRSAWLACHAPDASPLAPLTWLRDFHDARDRLREWVQDLGTELKQDRPTRQVAWPGEPAASSPGWEPITDRAADFGVHVSDDVAAREQALDEAQAAVAAERAELQIRLLELTRPDLADRRLRDSVRGE
jgi:hypothetical protein